MKKYFEPYPDAVGNDRAGLEIPLEELRGYRIKRTWSSKKTFGHIVLALVNPENSEVKHVSLAQEVYPTCVRVEVKKEKGDTDEQPGEDTFDENEPRDGTVGERIVQEDTDSHHDESR